MKREVKYSSSNRSTRTLTPNWNSPHSSRRLRTSSLIEWAKPHSRGNEHERTNTLRYVDTLARMHTKSGFHKRSNCDSGVNGLQETKADIAGTRRISVAFETNGKGFIGFVVQLPGASVHTYISTEMFYADAGNRSQGPE